MLTQHILELSRDGEDATIDLVLGIARLDLPADQAQDIGIEGATPLLSSVPNILRFATHAKRVGLAFRSHRDVVKIIARDKRGRALRLFAPREGKCPDDYDYLIDLGPVQGKPSQSTTPGEYVVEVDSVLEAYPAGRKRRFQKYFAELNKETHAHLVVSLAERDLVCQGEAEYRQICMIETKVTLNNRLVLRARGEVPPAPAVELRSYTEYLSRLQLGLIRKYFSKNTGAIDVDQFLDANELFANGNLRIRLPSLFYCNQPSSGFYFYFGEFALLAIDSKLPDSCTWAELAAPLIRSQIAFMKAYAPKVPSGYEAYCPCNYDRDKAFSLEKLRNLRNEYPLNGMPSVVEQSITNACEAFPAFRHTSAPCSHGPMVSPA